MGEWDGVEFEERELHIHVFTIMPEIEEMGGKENVKLDVFEGSDPFSDTDLPVQL